MCRLRSATRNNTNTCGNKPPSHLGVYNNEPLLLLPSLFVKLGMPSDLGQDLLIPTELTPVLPSVGLPGAESLPGLCVWRPAGCGTGRWGSLELCLPSSSRPARACSHGRSKRGTEAFEATRTKAEPAPFHPLQAINQAVAQAQQVGK